MDCGTSATTRRVVRALAVVAALFASTSAQAEETVFVRAGAVDIEKMQVTLPLQEGRMVSGESVWYVLLDASDRDTADRLGINFSDKLANSAASGALREAVLAPDGALVFEAGTVDFSPARKVEAGPEDAPFPPRFAQPGSIGDEDYSPLMRFAEGGGTIYNAPVLAYDTDADTLNGFCDGDADHALTHDKVVRICPRDGIVTLSLTEGFAGGKRLTYVSTESDVALVAALEGATHAPRMDDVPADLADRPFSAVEPIYVVVNGVTGAENGIRQGLESALADGLSPRNIVGDVPGQGLGYSPLWASHPVVWAPDALSERELLSSEVQVLALSATGKLRGSGGGFVLADGIIVNCPVVSIEE